MEKVVFLDIDGVLNNNFGEYQFLSCCVESVKRIIKDNEAKVVIISSLQGSGTIVKRKRLEDKLNRIGIEIHDFIDPNFVGDINGIFLPSRLLGIIDYLKYNKGCNYVILDDDYHNEYSFLGLNCFECDMWTGLQYESSKAVCFEKFDDVILNNINYCYRELGDYEKVTNDLIKVLKQIKTHC